MGLLDFFFNKSDRSIIDEDKMITDSDSLKHDLIFTQYLPEGIDRGEGIS